MQTFSLRYEDGVPVRDRVGKQFRLDSKRSSTANSSQARFRNEGRDEPDLAIVVLNEVRPRDSSRTGAPANLDPAVNREIGSQPSFSAASSDCRQATRSCSTRSRRSRSALRKATRRSGGCRRSNSGRVRRLPNDAKMPSSSGSTKR